MMILLVYNEINTRSVSSDIQHTLAFGLLEAGYPATRRPCDNGIQSNVGFWEARRKRSRPVMDSAGA